MANFRKVWLGSALLVLRIVCRMLTLLDGLMMILVNQMKLRLVQKWLIMMFARRCLLLILRLQNKLKKRLSTLVESCEIIEAKILMLRQLFTHRMESLCSSQHWRIIIPRKILKGIRITSENRMNFYKMILTVIKIKPYFILPYLFLVMIWSKRLRPMQLKISFGIYFSLLEY